MSTYKLGLIGFPLEHSHSPRIQQLALDYAKLKGEYSLFSIQPIEDWKKEISTMLDNMRQGEYHGLNVTVPFKEMVKEFLDSTTEIAEVVGAVNTIYLKGAELVGDNTDILGFWTDLNKHLNSGTDGEKKNALVLGAGGAARAVVFSLITRGWRIWVTTRRYEQALGLANDFTQRCKMNVLSGSVKQEHMLSLGERLQVINTKEMAQFLPRVGIDLVVNTTPLGMPPLVAENPWPEGILFPENALVYDLVYNPSKTKMMKQAEAQGLCICNGMGMLIEQAMMSFKLWTGISVPFDFIWQKLAEEGIE